MNENTRTEGQERQRVWEQHLEEWQRSGLSQTGYCRKHGLSHNGFVYWKKKLSGSSKDSVSLVEVPLKKLSRIHSVCPPLRLLVAGRYCMEIEQGFDADTLRRVLGVLEG